MKAGREKIGGIIGKAGWVIIFFSAAYAIFGYIDIYSDISVRAYAPLVLIEGGLYGFGGAVVVLAGRLIRGRRKSASSSSG